MTGNIDQDFVEYVVKSLVSKPDEVKVDRTIDEKGVLLELTVDPEDLGRVIGKRGGTAQSIRTLLRALGTKNDARYNLKIVDTDGGAGARQSTPRDDDNDQPAVSDDSQTDDTTPVEEADDNTVEDVQDEPVENESSEYEEKHRKDLADLDDLDI